MKLKTLMVFGVACCLGAVTCLVHSWIAERRRPTADVELYVPCLGCNSRTGQRVSLAYSTKFGQDIFVAIDNGLVVAGRDGTFTFRVTPEEAEWLRKAGPKAGYGLMQLGFSEPSWFQKIWNWLADPV